MEVFKEGLRRSPLHHEHPGGRTDNRPQQHQDGPAGGCSRRDGLHPGRAALRALARRPDYD